MIQQEHVLAEGEQKFRLLLVLAVTRIYIVRARKCLHFDVGL